MSAKYPRCEFVHGLKCEQVSRRIASLEAEVKSVREQLHTALDDTRWLNDENDRLKELVKEAIICHGTSSCDGCAHADECMQTPERFFAVKAHDLGIDT